MLSGLNVNLSVKHLLVDCPSFTNERRSFNIDGRSLKEILNDDAPVDRVFNFLKDIDLFYDI